MNTPNGTQPTDAVYLSVADERANTITHASGCLLSLIAAVALVLHPADPPWSLKLASLVYAFSMAGVYFCSTMSHAVFEPRRRNRWRSWDQGTIYCLISGTYTPFIWTCSPEGWRVPLLIAVWLAAAFGFYSKVFAKHRVNHSSTITYVMLGWFPALPLVGRTPNLSLFWMVAGGIAYTLGIYFLINDHRRKFNHAMWHLMVILGSTSHFIAIYQLGYLIAE